MKSLKNLVKIAFVSLIGLTGCRDMSNDFDKKGNFRGYPARAGISPYGRHVRLDADENQTTYILAIDMLNDGQFEEIRLRNLPSGHPLEKYADLDSLELAYKQISEEGTDIK